MRDDFSARIKRVLADRVGNVCSNPDCQKSTFGPHTAPGKRVNIGVAAHITAAAPGGPRYDPTLSPEDRKSIENGIWMCRNCGTLVDSDHSRFTPGQLRQWKREAEARARRLIEMGRSGRSDVDEDFQEREDRNWLIDQTLLLQQGEGNVLAVPAGSLEHERAERLVALGLLERAGLPYHYLLAGTFAGFSW